MALLPCSICTERFKGKPATAYWAWFNPLGIRQAFKQRYDPPCYGSSLRDWTVIADLEVSDRCPKCEEPIDSASIRVTYLNLYLPTRDPDEYIFQLCDICADELRSLATTGAEPLSDRTKGLAREPDRVQDPWAAYT